MSKTEDKISGGYTRRGSRHDTVVKGRSIASPVVSYEVLTGRGANGKNDC